MFLEVHRILCYTRRNIGPLRFGGVQGFSYIGLLVHTIINNSIDSGLDTKFEESPDVQIIVFIGAYRIQ